MRAAAWVLALTAVFLVGREFWRSKGGATTRGDAATSGIVLYTTSWCGVCRKARTYLTRREINFVDKVVDRDPVAQREFAAKRLASGLRDVVPVLDVRGELVVGFDAVSYERALQRFGQ